MDAQTEMNPNMKTFNDFNLRLKGDILKLQACYLLTINHDDQKIKLYAWDTLFIEQYSNSEGRLTRIRIVEDAQMDKFLKAIDLLELGYPELA